MSKAVECWSEMYRLNVETTQRCMQLCLESTARLSNLQVEAFTNWSSEGRKLIGPVQAGSGPESLLFLQRRMEDAVELTRAWYHELTTIQSELGKVFAEELPAIRRSFAELSGEWAKVADGLDHLPAATGKAVAESFESRPRKAA